ncbi:hypothetical protein BD779DRAFT_1473911 [Infundibulicybe gibba]|nr:hypothetical protein BD779DRAFT_1473911 [Infundibulicybe gibba]
MNLPSHSRVYVSYSNRAVLDNQASHSLANIRRAATLHVLNMSGWRNALRVGYIVKHGGRADFDLDKRQAPRYPQDAERHGFILVEDVDTQAIVDEDRAHVPDVVDRKKQEVNANPARVGRLGVRHRCRSRRDCHAPGLLSHVHRFHLATLLNA